MSKAPKTADAAEQNQAGREDVVGKRIEAMRTKRKERGEIDDTGLRQKLSFPEKLKDPRLEYRYVLDVETRKMEMEDRGWFTVSDDMISGDERNSGLGTVVQRIGNSRTTDKVQHQVLMAKPKEFYQEDDRKKQQRINERVAGLRRGETSDPQGLTAAESYIPAGGIKIE